MMIYTFERREKEQAGKRKGDGCELIPGRSNVQYYGPGEFLKGVAQG
jgi:hypothetical protein